MKSKSIIAFLLAIPASQAFAIEGTIDCNVKDSGPYERVTVSLGDPASDCMDFEQGLRGDAIKMHHSGDAESEVFDSACISAVQPERGDFQYTRKLDAKLATDRNVKVSLLLSPTKDQKLVVLNTKTARADVFRVQCKLQPSR